MWIAGYQDNALKDVHSYVVTHRECAAVTEGDEFPTIPIYYDTHQGKMIMSPYARRPRLPGVKPNVGMGRYPTFRDS